MRKFFTALIVIPLVLIFIVFAVANRHFVTVSFDPFNSADPSLAVALPLFALIIAVAIMGVVAGGSRDLVRPAALAAGGAPARGRCAGGKGATGRSSRQRRPSRTDPQRLPAPSPGGLYGSSGRDKQGATL